MPDINAAAAHRINELERENYDLRGDVLALRAKLDAAEKFIARLTQPDENDSDPHDGDPDSPLYDAFSRVYRDGS